MKIDEIAQQIRVATGPFSGQSSGHARSAANSVTANPIYPAFLLLDNTLSNNPATGNTAFDLSDASTGSGTAGHC
jgi:hypothetical protein